MFINKNLDEESTMKIKRGVGLMVAAMIILALPIAWAQDQDQKQERKVQAVAIQGRASATRSLQRVSQGQSEERSLYIQGLKDLKENRESFNLQKHEFAKRNCRSTNKATAACQEAIKAIRNHLAAWASAITHKLDAADKVIENAVREGWVAKDEAQDLVEDIQMVRAEVQQKREELEKESLTSRQLIEVSRELKVLLNRKEKGIKDIYQRIQKIEQKEKLVEMSTRLNMLTLKLSAGAERLRQQGNDVQEAEEKIGVLQEKVRNIQDLVREGKSRRAKEEWKEIPALAREAMSQLARSGGRTSMTLALQQKEEAS